MQKDFTSQISRNTEEESLISHVSHLTSKNYAIIVAGGSGSRMQSALPKQFLLLNGKAVLMYTIEAFYGCESAPAIIVVLPADYHNYWQELCKEHDFRIPHHLIDGGKTRFDSVKNGLTMINDSDAVIAVQDAVRPLTNPKVIDESFRYATVHGNAIVAVKSRDSIRQLKDGKSTALLRNEIYLVQTPQTFKSGLLRQAYEQTYHDAFTDDASVVESLGININMIEGDYTNIKITFPEDIAIAEMLFKQKSR